MGRGGGGGPILDDRLHHMRSATQLLNPRWPANASLAAKVEAL